MNLPRRLAGILAHERLLLASAALGIGSVAHADALTVSTATTAPLTTAAASNGSAGDITIDSAGSVIVATTDPAVTINSNNNLTINGTLQSSATSGATAILIDGTGGRTTTLTANGTAGITGTGGSGNYGLRIANGSVTGTIASSSTSTLTVAGTNSYGVSIESPFTGNITLNSVTVTDIGSTAISLTAPLTGTLKLTGASSASNSGGYGLHVASDVTGAIVNAGSLYGGATSTTITASDGTTSTSGPVAGKAVIAIEGNVTAGLLNDRYYVDANGAVVATASATSSDTLISGTITGYAGTPAILIQPSTLAQDIAIGTVGSSGSDDGYGIVNRAAISTAGSVAGTNATAISIAGADIGGTTYHVSIANGINNQSTGTIGATSIDATARAIDVGAAATVPTIVNAGTISATASNTAGGGSAYGIAIESGGTTTNIVNSGLISISASGTGHGAYGIADLGGSLTSITNSGTIQAVGGTGNVSRAIDLSAGTAAQTVTNSGKITGDIVFGSGGASYIANSGTLSGALAFGGGTNLIALDGTTAFANSISLASGGTLGITLAGTSSLSASGNLPTLSSLSASRQSQLILKVDSATPALTISGAASFTGQSSIKLVVTQAPGTTPVSVLTAGGGITTDHLSTLLSGTSTPYLYTLDSYGITGNALTVTLHQKSASEIGLDSRLAPLFDQSFAAFGSGTTFQAIANLSDQAAMLTAYRQILPPSYGSLGVRLAQSLQSAGNGMISARLDAIVNAPSDVASGARISPWVQQGATFLRHSDSQADPGFKSNAYNIAVGVDYAVSPTLIVGASGTFAWNDVTISGMATEDNSPLTVNQQMADIYAGWHSGIFFVQAIGSFGHSSYNFEREIGIGSITAIQTSKWSGTQYGGEINAGVKLRFGRFSVQPSNAFSHIRLKQDGYTESGGGAFDLKVDGKSDSASLNSTRLSIGYDLPFADGTLMLAARGAYVAQLDKTISPVSAQFVSGGDAFSLSSAPLKGSEVQGGLSIGYRGEGLYLALSGDRRQESGFSDTSAAVTLRMNF